MFVQEGNPGHVWPPGTPFGQCPQVPQHSLWQWAEVFLSLGVSSKVGILKELPSTTGKYITGW